MAIKEEELDRIYHALSDPTRRGILREVARGNPTVGELGRPFAMSGPAISKHLKVLEAARLLTRAKEGRVSRFRLNVDRLAAAAAAADELLGHGRDREDRTEPPRQSDDELEDYLR